MPVAPAAAVDAESSSGGALKALVAGILLLGTALLIITNHVRRADTTEEQLTRNNLPGQAGPIPPVGCPSWGRGTAAGGGQGSSMGA
ncbi:hypothetical protein [Streptomyces sp. NPDC056661]|uniref:hypothetical protein n=1 Tax=Streptomyces sp. NPDC056661 TaxID=3345898 RepID=UPI0036B71255